MLQKKPQAEMLAAFVLSVYFMLCERSEMSVFLMKYSKNLHKV